MDTRDLLKVNFTALEKRNQRGNNKELTPAEKQLILDKEAARRIVRQCCSVCKHNTKQDQEVLQSHLQDSTDMDSESCKECYAMYNEKTKRFWLARYNKE